MILAICLPWLVLQSLILLQVESALPGQEAWPLLVELAITPLFTTALLLYIRSCENVVQLSILEIWRLAIGFWPAMAVLTALSTLMILLGFSFFIIPGIYILIKLAFAECYLVFERQNPLRAMISSLRGTDGRFWHLFSNIIVLVIPIVALELWMSSHMPEEALGRFFLTLLVDTLQLSVTMVAYRLYTETE